jgi:hypothetical protein
MAEQQPDPPASVPPTSAPPGYAPPNFTAPTAPPGAPSFAPPTVAPPTVAPVTGYTPPAVAPAAATGPTAPAAYQAPSAYQAPAAYPPPTTSAPVPTGEAAPWNTPPVTPVTEWTQPVDDTPEQVGRGLLLAFGGVIAGIVLAIFLWQMGFVAALTGAVMAYACVWLYTKGAGRSPRKGAIALLVMILIGVLLSLVGAIGSDAVIVARKVFPNDTELQAEAVIKYLTAVKVWTANGTAVAMYLGFAALGSFSIFAGLAKARKAG